MPSAVLAKISHKVEGVSLVEAIKITIKRNQPITQLKTTAGKVLTGKGVSDTEIDLEFGQPSDRAQFEAFIANIEGPQGFLYEFTMGQEIFQVPNCFISNASVSYDPGSGSLSRSVTIKGAVMVNIAL